MILRRSAFKRKVLIFTSIEMSPETLLVLTHTLTFTPVSPSECYPGHSMPQKILVLGSVLVTALLL